MKYKVELTIRARDDLREIYGYIANTLQSEQSAVGQTGRIEKAILSLSEMPERHSLYSKEPWKSRNLRFVPVDNYIVFYIPDNDKMQVTITRIMYGARNIDKQLNTDL